MAVGLSTTEANAVLDGLSGMHIQLHVGDPGAAGTTNPAAETSRQQVTFNAASGGSTTNSGALTWSSITGSETATHWSGWSLGTGGVFRQSGTLTGPAYNDGDTVNIAVGAFTNTATGLAA